MKKQYKPKKLNFDHVCVSCGVNYKSADIKGTYCTECKKPKPCACGCGILVKTPGKLYTRGCKIRGKTYKEIYKSENPTNGFKKGSDNIMADPYYVAKVSEGVKNSYTPELRELRRQAKLKQIDNGFVYGKMLYQNSKGERFRSVLEYNFAEYLNNSGIAYEYESVSIPLVENSYGYKRKVPDFVINDILIEITGLAYDKWVVEFKQRMKLLKKSTNKPIIIITYPEKVSEVADLQDNRTFVINYFEVSEKLPILIKTIKT